VGSTESDSRTGSKGEKLMAKSEEKADSQLLWREIVYAKQQVLRKNGILMAEFCIVMEEGGVPMRMNSKGVLWSSPKPSLFPTRAMANRAITNSLRYAERSHLNWQRDDYRVVKLTLVMP
jgi:hypothetical protein